MSAAVSADIVKLHPKLVLLSERTADTYTSQTVLVSNAQVQAGLERTIHQLESASTKVAVIGDNPTYRFYSDPTQCLAAHPSAVQRCSTGVVNTSAKWRNHQPGEVAAARAEHVTLINPIPWLCPSKRCSPIVGNLVVYLDWAHVTATYAAFLATVMGAAIKPLL